MTSVPPEEGISVRAIQAMFQGHVPLRSRAIPEWPASMSHLSCLHCGGLCDVGPPIPAVHHYEQQLAHFWIFGPFCRSSCAFGYICERDSSVATKQMAATAEALRRYFGVSAIRIAPPRAAHQRYGGPLSDHEFHGLTGFTCLRVVQPPFVTFANYVVGVHEASGHSAKSTYELLPQSAGRLTGLSRPAQRPTEFIEKRPTGKTPMILEYLAALPAGGPTVQDATIDVRKTKRARLDDTSATAPTEAKGFLSRYMTGKPA